MNPTTRATPLLVFDGDCGICQALAGWAARRTGDQVTYRPAQALDLQEIGLTAQECAHAVQWLGVDGERASGAAAMAMVAAACRSPWPTLGRASRLPGVRVVSDAAYQLVARNRHRIRWGTRTCALPPAP